jgi:Contractile injection system tube protein
MESNLQKAKLYKIIGGNETSFDVQFNPETLKVSYSNQVVQPTNSNTGAGANRRNAPRRGSSSNAQPPTTQFVGKGATKLSVQLWFDVSGELPEADRGVKDVRVLTGRVVDLIKPVPRDNAPANSSDAELMVPPQVRFLWGTFKFEGIADSVEESLEFWSPEGRPLRANVSLGLSQQRIELLTGNAAAQAAQSAGTRKLTPAPAGNSLQKMADERGMGDNWQAIADANGIENPRNLVPGQLIDFQLQSKLGAGLSL